MRLSAVAFCMILTTIFLSGCGRQEMAALDDHGSQFFGRNGTLALRAPADPSTHAKASSITVATQDLPAPRPAAMTAMAPAPLLAASQPVFQPAGWQWPVDGQVVETFGQKSEGIAHEGIVIAAAEGTPIRAAQAGEVVFVGKDTKNFGNIVILRHADGDMTSYAHAREISVVKGAKVAAGSTLGTVGSSGGAKRPQLHFAVRENGASVDPLSKLPQLVAVR
jgi:murein DD-endopeptidase MepM/ murein hydrolase activator NlpD